MNQKQSGMDTFLIFLRGLLMGIADTIPGVSGGTIAFITGIYARLIHAFGSIDFSFVPLFFTGKFKKSGDVFRKIDFALLIPLLGGIGIAILLFSKLIEFLLVTFARFTYAFFFGLILASALVLCRRVGESTL